MLLHVQISTCLLPPNIHIFLLNFVLQEFRLIDKAELAPLEDLVESIIQL